MTLEKNIPEFEVMTKHQVYNVPDGVSEDEETQHIAIQVVEQNEILNSYGYPNSNDDTDLYVIHFFNSAYSYDSVSIITLYDAIQGLAIKDGVDLVKYDNDRIGFVAYYNGHKDGFEILAKEADLMPGFLAKLENGKIEAFDGHYSNEFNFDCYLDCEDNIRTLVDDL